jgi:hypothetical protein
MFTEGAGEDADDDAFNAKKPKLTRENLPTNLHTMTVEQLRMVCAANGIVVAKVNFWGIPT